MCRGLFWITIAKRIVLCVVNQEVVTKLKLQREEQVLDVGCGLGGAAFLMAQVRACMCEADLIQREQFPRNFVAYVTRKSGVSDVLQGRSQEFRLGV